jgi:hypothetical protein
MSTFDRSGGPSAAGLWAITSYFNPMGYRRRLANYRLFRARLNVPLVAVELAYGPDFELNADDADVLIQLRGRDVLWQKERLLNLALQALPGECSNVAWLDCDVIFEDDDWPERVNKALQDSAILQPYSHVYHLPREWAGGPMAKQLPRQSVAFAIASGTPAAACLGESSVSGIFNYSRGFAWAARRELLEKHRFYDALIVGGGDRALAATIYDCHVGMMHYLGMDDRPPHDLNDWQKEQYLSEGFRHSNSKRKDHYLAWGQPFYNSVRANVGFVEGNLFHLWHGRSENRRYRERIEGLRQFEFDPFTDIAIDQNGAWTWNSNKHELHDYVRAYFAGRREDE